MWRDTIRRAVLQSDGARLRGLAEALLKKGEEGDVPALKEIGDRLDGRVPQAVAITGENGGPLLVANPESLAAMTDEQLQTFKEVYDKLIVGVAADGLGDSQD